MNHIIKCQRCGELFEGKTLARTFCDDCNKRVAYERVVESKNKIRALEGKPPIGWTGRKRKVTKIKCTLRHYTGDFKAWKEEMYGR